MSRLRNNEIKVGILKSYSYNYQSRQIIETTQYEQDKYEIWVYPDGIKIYDSNYNIINDLEPQFSFGQSNIIHTQKVAGNIQSTQGSNQPQDNIYSFVLTDYDLNRTYCTCAVWNEKKFVENDEEEFKKFDNFQQSITLRDAYTKIPNLNSKILPKCTLSQLVQDPLVLDPTSSLVYIPKGLIICSKHPCLNFQKDLMQFIYMNAIKKYDQATIRKKQMDDLKNLIAKFGYPQAQKLYDQEQFLNQSEYLSKKFLKQLPTIPSKIRSKRTILRLQRQQKQNKLNLKSLRTLEKKKFQQFYLSFAFLPELIQVENQNEVPVQVVQIQDTISSKRLCDKLSLQPYYYSSTCFKIPNFNIIETINRIGIQNILTLWKSAVLERQILVFSSDQFLTIQLFQTLLYLLEPLKWQNIYIPFLPFHLCHHIEALGGYFIGMSKIHMNYMIEHFSLQSKVFVDLDQMIIIQEGGNNIINIPSEIKVWMVSKLQQLGFKDKQSKEQSKLWNFDLSKLVHITNQRTEKAKQQDSIKFKTIFDLHKIFYIGLFYILNNYSSFIQEDGNNVKFDREGYSNIFLDQEQKKFSSEFVKTMMFVRLCEFHKNSQKSLKWNQADICSLFVYCHYIMNQNESSVNHWAIKDFESEQVPQLGLSRNDKQANQKNASKQTIQNNSQAQKFNEYVNYVIKKNIKELTGSNVETRSYKVEHYLVKYLNYLNYNHPGVIATQESKKDNEELKWFEWLKQLIRLENIEKQEIHKKQKLNKVHDFWRGNKNIVNLKNLFKQIGLNHSIGSELKKNLLLESWSNAKMLQKMKFNRDHAKSSCSVK